MLKCCYRLNVVLVSQWYIGHDRHPAHFDRDRTINEDGWPDVVDLRVIGQSVIIGFYHSFVWLTKLIPFDRDEHYSALLFSAIPSIFLTRTPSTLPYFLLPSLTAFAPG
jgi:hypothetical protein